MTEMPRNRVDCGAGPCVRRYSFSKLGDAQETIGRLLKPHAIAVRDQTSTAVRARLIDHRFENLSISLLSYGTAVDFHTAPLEDSFVLLLPLTGTGRVGDRGAVSGISSSTGALFSPDTALHARFEATFDHRVVKIERRFLERHVAEYRCANAPSLSYQPAIDLWSVLGRNLTGVVDLICNYGERFERDDGARRSVRELTAVFLDALVDSLQARQPVHSHAESVSLTCVERVAEFVNADPGAELTVSRLAAHAAVSPRTLFAAFKKHKNVTPMAFVRSVRLGHVRRELRSGGADGARIQMIAMRWGFSHMGEFAAAYRAAFGELPSATLRYRSLR